MNNSDSTKFHSDQSAGSDNATINSQNMLYSSFSQQKGSERSTKPIFSNDKPKSSSFRIDDLLETPSKILNSAFKTDSKAYIKPINETLTNQFKQQYDKLSFLNKLKNSLSNENFLLQSTNFDKNKDLDFYQSTFCLFNEMNSMNKHALPNAKIDFLPLLYQSNFFYYNYFFYF